MQSRTFSLRRALTSLAVAALVATGLATAAAPAHADGGSLNGPTSVLISQPVTYTLSGSVPSGVLVLTNNGTEVATAFAEIGAQSATFSFTTPAAPTTMALQVLSGGAAASNALGVSVTGLSSTSTSVAAPDTAKVGVATKITVTVNSQSPSTYNPTGQVVVKDINGATLQTMGLTAGQPGQSFAYWWWTPQTAGTYTFVATYQGDAYAPKSVSPQDLTIASPNGQPITLVLPGTLTAGVPTTLKANVYPSSLQGSVGFTVNGQPISASIPIQNGTASFTWTPPAAGQITIGASYTTNQGGSGSTSQQVTVVAGPVTPDQITLTVPGVTTWMPNGTYTVAAGSNTTFTASSLSGAPVVLSETGPCALNGMTLVAGPNGTTCNLVAKSAGGNGYAPVSYGYTVQVGIGQQTANVNPPISGRVNKGKVIVLEGPGQGDTNAGQNIVWSVKKSSRSVCKLGFPADGSVTVKLVKKGSCTVTGKAPGVPGQWAPYSIARTYTA